MGKFRNDVTIWKSKGARGGFIDIAADKLNWIMCFRITISHSASRK